MEGLDGPDADTEMGPVANRPQHEKVLELQDGARAEGATIACGGEPGAELGGLFVEPTVVLAGPENTIVKEEVFGFGLSGIGRENGVEAVNEYLENKSVLVELTGGTRDPFQLG